MKTQIAHALHSVEQFIQLWKGQSMIQPEQFISESVTFSSSYRGVVTSRENLISFLKQDFISHDHVDIQLSNVVKKSSGSTSKISGYFYAQASKNQEVYFGGMLIFTLKNEYIQDIKIQLNWVDGNKELLSHWILPLDSLWKPNDPMTTISSEFNSLWQKDWMSNEDAETQIAESWYRYAWALDLADTSLHIENFTENATTDLPPMGIQKGKRNIISTLKAFRMPWPSIQHYGEPLHIEIDPSHKSAYMIIGRIIPNQSTDKDGQKIYAAHYQIELQCDDDTLWKIHDMKYISGWVRQG